MAGVDQQVKGQGGVSSVGQPGTSMPGETQEGAVAAWTAVRLLPGVKVRVGQFPSYKTVLNHVASWERVARLLDREGR